MPQDQSIPAPTPDHTALTPLEEVLFRLWATKNGFEDVHQPADLRGLYKTTQGRSGLPGEHLPDKWKQAPSPPPQPQEADTSNWDKRNDGSNKGSGFLGVLQTPDGGSMSELSVGAAQLPSFIDHGRVMNEDDPMSRLGFPIDVPSITPNQSPNQLKALLNWHEPQDIGGDFIDNAISHANQRVQAGQPIFARPGEQQFNLSPDLPRRAVPSDVPLATSRQSVDPNALARLLMQRGMGR